MVVSEAFEGSIRSNQVMSRSRNRQSKDRAQYFILYRCIQSPQVEFRYARFAGISEDTVQKVHGGRCCCWARLSGIPRSRRTVSISKSTIPVVARYVVARRPGRDYASKGIVTHLTMLSLY